MGRAVCLGCIDPFPPTAAGGPPATHSGCHPNLLWGDAPPSLRDPAVQAASRPGTGPQRRVAGTVLSGAPQTQFGVAPRVKQRSPMGWPPAVDYSL